MRGIQNASGVSCHISCALQIVCHTVPPLREALVHLHETRMTESSSSRRSTTASASPSFQNENALSELGVFFAALVRDEDGSTDEAVDPTALYQMLETMACINPHNVGDSSTAIFKILDLIRKGTVTSSSSPLLTWNLLCDKCIFGGMTRQTIRGRKQRLNEQNREHKKDTIYVRTKQGKLKEMAVPFPLVGAFGSLSYALQAALEDHVVTGYHWDSSSGQQEYLEEEQEEEETAANLLPQGREWATSKALQVERLPMFWMIHLERFSYLSNGQKTLSNPKVEIPLRLDTSLYFTTQEAETFYRLLGAILHVSEDGSIEEEGHFVTVLRRTTRNRLDNQNEWAMIDDETCTFVTEMEVLEMAGGTMDTQGRFLCATLLVYGAVDDDEDHAARDELDQLLAQLKGEISERATTEPSPLSKETNDDMLNEQVVGQRLRVKWAKGRLYRGIVVSYDPSTRKHRVQYDDGDIREYNLAKKTIEWENG
jgi:hypothetical protein